MPTVDSLLAAALTLPPADRAALADRLVESLPSDAPPGPDGWPANLHPAWKDEIARRSAEPEDDDIPWEQVQREGRELLDRIDRERQDRG